MSISIGKHLNSRLSASEAIKNLVGDRIYAISTKTSTSFPFVIFKRSGLTPNATKDRHGAGDNVIVDIVVASDNYASSVEVAEAIRASLDNKRGKYEAFDVIDSRLISTDEDFIEDTFIQRLTFSFETE